MAAIDKSIYEEIFIESVDRKRTVDIRSGVISIDYYEDIFSPVITAKIRVVNTGDSIQGRDERGNIDGPMQAIYNGLPLRGGERVSMKIKGNSSINPGINFSTNPKNYLYVSAITDVFSETNRESFLLHLTSREAITNETSRIGRKYPTSFTIDASVKDILYTYLKASKVGQIDKSKNKYGFIGNMKKPFTVLVWLASKAVPVSSKDSTAGFLFYQTKDGFQFRSIDNLITQQHVATYEYTQVNKSKNERNNDFFILRYSTDKNQNLIEKLRLGTYSSTRIYFNPLTFGFTEPKTGKFTMNNYSSGVKNLGKKINKENAFLPDNLSELPTRILTQVMDLGTLDPNVSITENADPSEYQSQSLMRYNSLLTQSLSIVVPSNTNLRAGDIIMCKFPKITRQNTDSYDDQQSGLYMIKELCHHFDTDASYTSMKLVRDTFGMYGTNNK